MAKYDIILILGPPGMRVQKTQTLHTMGGLNDYQYHGSIFLV